MHALAKHIPLLTLCTTCYCCGQHRVHPYLPYCAYWRLAQPPAGEYQALPHQSPWCQPEATLFPYAVALKNWIARHWMKEGTEKDLKHPSVYKLTPRIEPPGQRTPTQPCPLHSSQDTQPV